MSPATPTTAALRLSSAESWFLHHVLLDRLEQERRSPSTTGPPPIDVFRAFERLESGDTAFTPAELRGMREEVERYLERTDGPGPDRTTGRGVLDRLEAALAAGSRRRLTPDRRTPPG